MPASLMSRQLHLAAPAGQHVQPSPTAKYMGFMHDGRQLCSRPCTCCDAALSGVEMSRGRVWRMRLVSTECMPMHRCCCGRAVTACVLLYYSCIPGRTWVDPVIWSMLHGSEDDIGHRSAHRLRVCLYLVATGGKPCSTQSQGAWARSHMSAMCTVNMHSSSCCAAGPACSTSTAITWRFMANGQSEQHLLMCCQHKAGTGHQFYRQAGRGLQVFSCQNPPGTAAVHSATADVPARQDRRSRQAPQSCSLSLA